MATLAIPRFGGEHLDRESEIRRIRGDAADDLDLAGDPHQRDDRGLAEGHADQHQAAAGGDQISRSVEQGGISGALDDRTRRSDMAAHLPKLGDDDCRAEIQSEVATVLDRIDADDRADLTGMQGRHREEPDGAEPDHHRGVAGVQVGALDAMDRHRERLDKAGVLEGQAGRQAVELRRGHGDQLGEAAVASESDAGGERHRAPVRRAGPAVSARAAGDLGVDDGGLTCGPPGDAVAECLDDPGHLMTGDRVGEEADLVRGQIRSADAAAVDADHHLAGDCLGCRDIGELEVVRLEQPDRSHRYISPS